jgi:hypothetical protein
MSTGTSAVLLSGLYNQFQMAIAPYTLKAPVSALSRWKYPIVLLYWPL